MHLPACQLPGPIIDKTYFQGPAEVPDSKQLFLKTRVPKRDYLCVEENGLNFAKLSECERTQAGLIWGFTNASFLGEGEA